MLALLELNTVITMPEEARKKIDTSLRSAGWILQDLKDMNLGAGVGVAAIEFPLKGAGLSLFEKL